MDRTQVFLTLLVHVLYQPTLDLESTPGVTLPVEVKYENRRGQ